MESQLSNHHQQQQQHIQQQLRSESPSSWIKSNLEQLTSGDNKSASAAAGGPLPVLPGFNNLSLNASRSGGGLGSSSWNNGIASGSQAPPPGFAMNRGIGGGGPMVGGGGPGGPYQNNLSGNSSNGDNHQMENKKDYFTMA